MTHVVVAGHWPGSGLGATNALNQVARGIKQEYPPARVDVIPFGPEAAFLEATALAGDHGFAPIVIERSATSSQSAGTQTMDAWRAELTPVLEGGHQWSVDCGLGFLSVLADLDVTDGSADHIHEGIRRALARWGTRHIIAAASTKRPLLGMNSVMALDPELGTRSQDRAFSVNIARGFAQAPRPSAFLPLAGGMTEVSDPARIDGSGAGGGVAAMVAALGGRIIETGAFLADLVDVNRRIADADLVCVLEPHLDSPLLAEATLSSLTQAAAQAALPVVALGTRSSLSGYERAEWGIHGILLTPPDQLVDAGRRVAHTWIAH